MVIPAAIKTGSLIKVPGVMAAASMVRVVPKGEYSTIFCTVAPNTPICPIAQTFYSRKGRGFAGAVGAKQTKYLAAVNFKTHTIDGNARSIRNR